MIDEERPPFCVPFDTAQGAASIMKHYDVHFIPIVENEPNHMLVGVVTDRDLCLRVVAEGKNTAKFDSRIARPLTLSCAIPRTISAK